MSNLRAGAGGVKRQKVYRDRVEPAVQHFWSRRSQLDQYDLDMIDGTFLSECCEPLPNEFLEFVNSLEYEEEEGFPAIVQEQQVLARTLGGLSSVTLFTPRAGARLHVGVSGPMWGSVSTTASAIVIDQTWDDEVVQQRLRDCWNLHQQAPGNYGAQIRRLPSTVVVPPSMELVPVGNALDDFAGDELEGFDESRWGVDLSIFAHDTRDGLPPANLIAVTYDAVTQVTGWRKKLRQSMLNQEPVQAIRGWAIALLMRTGMTEADAIWWFEERFPFVETPGDLSHSTASFREARAKIVRRVPAAWFLKRSYTKRITPPMTK